MDILHEKYIHHYKKGRMLIAGILSAFLWCLMIFLCVIFLISGFETVNDFLIIAILIGGVVMAIIGTICIIWFFITIPSRQLKSFVYKSDFLVMDYQKDTYMNGLYGSYIYGLSYDEGNCKLLSHRVAHYDVEFIKNVECFEIVSRYSKNKNPKNLEMCLFTRKEKM